MKYLENIKENMLPKFCKCSWEIEGRILKKLHDNLPDILRKCQKNFKEIFGK